jgi:hypothetical protein
MPSSRRPFDTYIATFEAQGAWYGILPAAGPSPRLMHSLKLYETVDTAIGKVQSDHDDHRHPRRMCTALG